MQLPLCSEVSNSISQINTVLQNTANATHKIEQVRLYIDGHTAHISGLLTCVYAPSDTAYNVLLSSSALPVPKAGLAYCETDAGDLVFDSGIIKVSGGTKGKQVRFHDSYAV